MSGIAGNIPLRAADLLGERVLSGRDVLGGLLRRPKQLPPAVARLLPAGTSRSGTQVTQSSEVGLALVAWPGLAWPGLAWAGPA